MYKFLLSRLRKVLEWVVTHSGAFLAGFFTGARHEKTKQSEDESKIVKEGLDAQDRVAIDPDYRERVRDEYR